MSFDQAQGIRGKWKYDKELRRLVPCEDKKRPNASAYVHTDEVDAFRAHHNNQWFTSKKKYRDSLKRENFIELGNEEMPAYKPPSAKQRQEEIRRDVEETANQIKWGMAPSTEKERELWKREQEALNRGS